MRRDAPELISFDASDGHRLWARVWRQPEPRGRVVVLHGIVSHGGWYARSCRALSSEGFEVHLPERRGSGLDLGSRGDVGHWSRWLEDLEQYVQTTVAGGPVVLLGISWGGKLAVAAAARGAVSLAGLGLICPGLFARQAPSRLQRFLLQGAAHTALGRRKVRVPLEDPALFTADRRWQAYVGSDPLALRQVTVRFAAADAALTRCARAAAEQIHVPTLLMLAERDRIVDNQATRRFVQSFATPDKHVLQYADAGHTLEFDPQVRRYIDDLTHWISRTIAGNQNAGKVPARHLGQDKL